MGNAPELDRAQNGKNKNNRRRDGADDGHTYDNVCNHARALLETVGSGKRQRTAFFSARWTQRTDPTRPTCASRLPSLFYQTEGGTDMARLVSSCRDKALPGGNGAAPLPLRAGACPRLFPWVAIREDGFPPAARQ